MNYNEKELVSVAKRENNNKRKYLVVNPLQGKHVPISPSTALEMFDELANKVKNKYIEEKLLLVGFAETATAIGAELAVKLNSMYMQTTRENIPEVEYFYFSESHSHASEQRLVLNDLDRIIDSIDRIMFVEDEVTTGNTIMHIISLIEESYPNKVKFCVASLLNGMNKEALEAFNKKDIWVHYLVKTNHETYTEIANKYKGDGTYIKSEIKEIIEIKEIETDENNQWSILESQANLSYWEFHGGINGRRLILGKDYETACEKLWHQVENNLGEMLDSRKKVLIIGTEEFMYPALYIGKKLEKLGIDVKSHSTTRSPIVVSSETNYPLHKRYELVSLYENERTTYIYDLKKYDEVIVLTDSHIKKSLGMKSLINALIQCGNENISIISWKESVGMHCSYREEDVTILLKDITGLVKPQSTAEREKLIQAGTHYCEMLPIEYVPTEKYMKVYEEALRQYSKSTALAVGKVSDKIIKVKGRKVVLVSLARAGIPIGILIKHFVKEKYHIDVPHYAISIIRGRGIDDNAMKYLLENYSPEQLQFVDGWIGKGAILLELKNNMTAYNGVSSDIAVVADPANITNLCGTHEDILIPSSCLNSTVSGLISRTFLREDIIKPTDFHGAAYYSELAGVDLSQEFINTIESQFEIENTAPVEENNISGQGVDQVRLIAKHFNIDDINLVKPGIGETTRVLLRRVPWKVIIDEKYREDMSLAHIVRLAEEKNVPIEYYPLSHYKCCGIIKKLADA